MSAFVRFLQAVLNAGRFSTADSGITAAYATVDNAPENADQETLEYEPMHIVVRPKQVVARRVRNQLPQSRLRPALPSSAMTSTPCGWVALGRLTPYTRVRRVWNSHAAMS